MEKRIKHLTAKLFCLLLLSAVLSACQSDLYDFYEFEQVETNGFDIADARNWFEAHAHRIRPNEVLTRSADGSEEVVTRNPVFNWNIAEMSNNPEWEVVELPWKYENVVQIFALAEVWQHALTTNSVPENVTRLVVMQHRATGATYGFKMKIAPTLDYLLSHGGSLSDNKLLDRDSRLSGVVLFYTLSGLFVNGWAYQNGEIVAELVAKNRVDAEDVNAPTTRAWWNDDPSHNFWLDQVVVSANLHTQGGDTSWFDNLWGADWFAVTSAPSGSGGGSGGGGSGSGMPDLTAMLCDDGTPNADRIFRNPDGIQQQFNEILKDCMGEALVRELANRLGSNRLNLELIPGNVSRYDPNTRTVIIGNAASGAPVVFHELLHALQHMNYSTMAAYEANQMNHEIEAQLAQYMFVRRNAQGSSIGTWNTHFNSHPKYFAITQMAEYVDRRGNITNASRFNAEVRNAVPHFQASPLYNRLQFNPNMSMNNMFANLRRLSVNC